MKWRLREFLAEQGFRRATHISRTILERTGYPLCVQAVCDLLNEPPKMLRIETMQAICDAFYCRLADFCDIVPDASVGKRAKRKPAIRAKARASQRDLTHDSQIDFADFFPDARQYLNRADGD